MVQYIFTVDPVDVLQDVLENDPTLPESTKDSILNSFRYALEQFDE